MNTSFDEQAWEHYIFWQLQDRKTLAKINKLIDDINRNGESEGIGHPEPLHGDKTGWWSRHIDKENRLVYRVKDGRIEIDSCKGHYEDK